MFFKRLYNKVRSKTFKPYRYAGELLRKENKKQFGANWGMDLNASLWQRKSNKAYII